jgi:hypothetical protein
MATFSNLRANYGLISVGTHTKTRVENDVEVGVPPTGLTLADAEKCYVISATLATIADTLTIDTATGVATIGTTPVPQVETATVVAAGGATSNGNLAVTVTAARVTGSPLGFSVPLTTVTHTTATLIAGAIRTAFNANAALREIYTVGGTGADITLTETSAENNDGTLNIAITAGLGVSAASTSTNSTAGVGGVKLTNNTGDGKDMEGVSLGTLLNMYACLIRVTSGSASFDHNGGIWTHASIPSGGFAAIGGTQDVAGTGNLVITAEANTTTVEVTFAQDNA